MMRSFLLGVIVLLLTGHAMAQWDGGNCPVGQTKPLQTWVKAIDDEYGRYLLWEDGKLLGAMDPVSGHWWAWNEPYKMWGAEQVERNGKYVQDKIGDCPDWQKNGCRKDKIHPDRFSVGGVETDPRSFFGAGALPDSELGKGYICCVGSEEFLTEAKALFAPNGPCSPILATAVVGFFHPSDWQVKGVGADRPGVTIYGPRGKDEKAVALHFQPDLKDLDKAATIALREKNPQFKESEVPDLRATDPSPAVEPTFEVPSQCLLTFGVMTAIAYFLNRKDK